MLPLLRDATLTLLTLLSPLITPLCQRYADIDTLSSCFAIRCFAADIATLYYADDISPMALLPLRLSLLRHYAAADAAIISYAMPR